MLSSIKVIIIEPGGYGATFQYAHNLANALSERNHYVAMATGLKFETRNFPVKYEALETFDRFIPRPFRLASLFRYVHAFKPKIIHIQGHLHPETYLLIWKALKTICNAKLVYTAQDIVPKVKKIYHPIALKKLYSEAFHIFVNAYQNKRMLIEKFPFVSPDTVSIINIADLTAFVPSGLNVVTQVRPNNRKVLLFFGIIEPSKGLLYLIRAFAKVCKQVPNAYLSIVGKAFVDVKPYIEEIKRLRIDRRINFRNEYIPLDEIPKLFADTDVFVAPYLQGWNSGGIATAFAHGKPVVASEIGGISEVVKNGNNGLLVPPGDEEALADALIRILTENELRMQMAKAAREKADMNSWSDIAFKTEEVYRSVLALS